MLPPISNDPYFYSSSRVHKVPLEVLGTWVPLERRYWEGVHRWSGGMRVGLLPIFGGQKRVGGISGFFFGGWRFLTPISLQGEPGEPGSPGVQGEPGVKVSGSSEALLCNPLHPLNPTPTFPLTSWSWNSCAAHESVLLVILREAWSLDPGGPCPLSLKGRGARDSHDGLAFLCAPRCRRCTRGKLKVF